MSDKDYRVVGDRIITEEKYRSEQQTAQFMQAAEQFKFISVPFAVGAFILVLIFLDAAWFWRLLWALFAAGVAYIYSIPAISLLILIVIGFIIYKLGGFG